MQTTRPIMRRIAILLTLLLLAAGALAGCGGSSSSSSASPVVSVSGAFGKAPSVKIPAKKASSQLVVKTLVHGNGPALASNEAFVGNFALYVWNGTSHKLLNSTFTKNTPILFSGQLLPGMEKALTGEKVGSRVLAVIPPKQAFGSNGNPQAGIKGTDTLVFIVDLIKAFTGSEAATGQPVSHGGKGLPKVSATTASAPAIKMPGSKPPAHLVTKILIKGTGPAISKGQTVVVQYVGAIWKTGKVFDSSWTRHQPFGFTIGATPGQVIPGWDQGLVGEPVGSRVLLSIPPADGYGKTGNSQAGIKGTDTLVFVVDILGAFGSPAA
jgi:FKBP-type peptidyl-prolyl cis-trans isomerase